MAENEKQEQAVQAASDKVDKTAKKAEKKDKPSIFARAAKWLKEMKSELKKVQWPTRKQTINNTLIVIACVVVVGIFIWVFDFIAGNAIELLLSLLG
jgi:preprotein translocase subunit SecE